MRLLPDVDLLVREVVTSAVPGVNVGTMIPADLADRLPFVMARRVGGTAVHPRFADRALVDVQVWASDRKTASDLAESVRTALFLAWERQTVTPYGSIGAYAETAAPTELRDETTPDGVYRFQATYSLVVRPA